MEYLRQQLLNFNSATAAYAFLIALTIGVLAIIANFLLPATPVLLVLAYGSLLVYVGKKYMIYHSEMTKNSPYFLAFSLFMISVFTLFSRSGPLEAPQILPQMGAALLPTVFGLALRQLLFAFDSSQREQDAFYRSFEEELRRSATEFKKAQQRLVDIINEFAETRVALFAREEAASEQYMDSFARAAKVFSEIAEDYPKAISKAITQLNQRLTRVLEKFDEFLRQTEPFDSNALAKVDDQFRRTAEICAELATHLREVNTSAGTLLTAVNFAPQRIDAMFKNTTEKLNASTTAIAKETVTAFTDIKDKVATSHDELRSAVRLIHEDLAAIDQIVSEFSKLIGARIKELAEERVT